MELRLSKPEEQVRHFISLGSAVAMVAALSILGLLLPGGRASADNAGYALAFTGPGERVVLGSTIDLFGGTEWTSAKTITIWVRVDGTESPATTPESGQILVANDRPHTFGVSRAIFNGADRIWVWNSGGSGIDAIGIDFTVGEWMQIALVHDSGVLYAYKNGELAGQIVSGPTYLPSDSAAGTVFIGGNSRGTSTGEFKGEIDEVRFWNGALTQSSIQDWLNRELDTSHPRYSDLSAYYQMSDGAGTILTDDSGKGHQGTLLGGMGDQSWVTSNAFFSTSPTPTNTPLPAATSQTPVAASATPTATMTLLPPSPTNTTAPSTTPTATLTLLPPSPTNTTQPPTSTPPVTPPTFTPTYTPSLDPATWTPSATPTVATATATSTETPTATTQAPTSTPSVSATPGSTGAGYALSFDGINDFVELPTTNSIYGNGWADTQTASLWVKPDVEAGACDHNLPAWCNNILGDRPRWWGISIGGVVGLDRIWVWNYDGSPTSPIDMIPIDYTPGQWVHVALVHSNGILRAYRNGIEVGSLPSGTTQQPNTGAQPQLNLGGIINNSNRVWTFDGQIDEVRLWSIARSGADIRADLYHSIDGSTTGLAAYYKMSDGSGSVLTDDTGHGKNGVLYDGARGVPPDGSPPEWVNSTAPLDDVVPTAPPTEPATATPSLVTTLPTQTPLATSTPSATPEPPSPTPIDASVTPSATPTITPTPSSTNVPSPTPTSGAGLNQVSALDTSGNAYDADVVGNLAYVAANAGGLRVIDVSDPLNPNEIGSFSTATRAYGVDADGNLAYVAATSSGVYILDVSDPTAPVALSVIDAGGYAWDVNVRGNYLYVSDRLDGLHVIDISDPNAPQEVGFVPTLYQTLDSAVYGTTMYIANYLGGIQIADVSDPTNTQLVGHIDTYQTYGIMVRNNQLFVADGGAGLQVFDLTDPWAPTRIGGYSTGGSVRSSWNEGNVTYIADWTLDLFALDSTDPSAMTLLDHVDTSGRGRDVLVHNGIVYLADYGGGLLLFTGP